MTRPLSAIPVARRSDPLTSQVGEYEVTVSGRRGSHCADIETYVFAHAGQPRAVIARALDLSEYECSKRLSDVKNAGRIRQGAPVRVVSGRLQATWWPVAVEPKQLRFLP